MKCVFIANVKSGKGKIRKFKEYILAELNKKFDDIVWEETKHAGHATELAEQYAAQCDYLLFSGGDGTLNEIINGVMKSEKRPILGQIPAGTVNDFSKSIGMKKNIKKAVKQILTCSEKSIDVYSGNGKYGVYIYGFGVFTRTSYATPQSKKSKMGWLSYFFSGIKEIKTYTPQTIEFDTGGETRKAKAALFLIINSKSVGGFKFNKNAKLNDGKADFCLFMAKKNKIRLPDLFRLAKLFLFGFGSIKNSKSVVYEQISSMKITSDSVLDVNYDGEMGYNGNQLDFRVIHDAVRIIAPSKNI